MTDLSQTITPKSDQANADDFISGPRTITVTKVTATSGDQPISIFFEGDNGKPFKPCKSMRRVLVIVWGKNGNEYIGRSMTLYNDVNVKWAGKSVGGIRISHLSHIDNARTIALTVTRGNRKPYTVQPLQAQASVDIDALTIEGAEAAQRGMAALGAFWKRIPKTAQASLTTIKDNEWKPMAEQADQDSRPTSSPHRDGQGEEGEVKQPSSPTEDEFPGDM